MTIDIARDIVSRGPGAIAFVNGVCVTLFAKGMWVWARVGARQARLPVLNGEVCDLAAAARCVYDLYAQETGCW